MDEKWVLMGRYEVGRVLGQGSFAKVYYGRRVGTGQSVAIKVIDKDKVLRVGLMEQIKREITVMAMLRHPNIVYLYEVMATKSKIYFVMEYAKGGELFDKVAKGRLKEDSARSYFCQLINALDFCHSRGVYHRDLKPENLLLDENQSLKVTDFGLSALAESKRHDGLLHTTCGTPAYVAPEIISRKGYDGAKADIWSSGVILFVLLAGYLPFHDSNLMEMYRKIGKADYKCPTWIPKDLRRLLANILDPNPDTRISIAQIKDTSWFRKNRPPSNPLPSHSHSHSHSHSQTTADPGPSSGCRSSVAHEHHIRPAELNAFDIISLSCGFDLSGLFEDTAQRKEARFTSRQPASNIISRLTETANTLNFKVKRTDKGLLNFEGLNEGRKGPLSIDAEIFEVAQSLYLVEMRKAGGDTLEYHKLLKDDIRPALHDIVWAWQGEQQHQRQKQTLENQQ
ncbi:hypothetical protein vseg_010016 [Gypsophila vaccaria]